MNGRGAAPVSRRTVLGIFLLSGASALVYQVLWARQLGLVFGNTTLSISVVLAAFMAGLALGAALAGRILVGRSDPLRVYAWIEGGIGLYALLFSPLVRALEALYPALFSDESAPLALMGFRVFFALALLLPPTILMGATLPLLTESLHRLGVRRGDWNAGRLYAANTFGAALGSVASGFFAIELLGIQATTFAAALLNLLVMAIALAFARRAPPVAVGGESPPAAEPAVTREPRRLLFLFSGTGALAMAAEVLWSRALIFFVGSSTYAFSAILVAYLVGIALGSWIASRFVRRLRDPGPLLPFALLAAGAWHALAIACVDPLVRSAGRLLAGPDMRAMAPGLLGVYAVLLLLLLPPAMLSGAVFPVVTRLVGGESGDRGAPIARAYTWNTVGAIAGSLLAGFAIAPAFVQFHALHVLVLASVALSALAWWAIGWKGRPKLAGATLLGSLLLALWSGRALRETDLFVRLLLLGRPGTEVTHHGSGLQGTTTVLRATNGFEGASLLLVNGVGMTFKGAVTKAMAHLPLVAHGRAEDTLVICFGMGTTFRSALSHGGRVDVVELVPEVFDLFGHFYADAEILRRSPSGRMIVNDGRNFLLLTRKRYDVITIDPPPPIDGAGVSHLYSREFLELVKSRLRPGGIAAHWLPQVHPLSGVPDAATRDMLLRTFRVTFPHAIAIEGQKGSGTHVLGSLTPFAIDPARVEEAIRRPAVARDMAEFPWDPMTSESFFRSAPLPPRDREDIPLLTDDRPRLEFSLVRNARAGLLYTMLKPFL
jgi:spermidine synthase